MKFCAVPGCNKDAVSLSRPWARLCNHHKVRNRRHGDALQIGVTKAELHPFVDRVRRRVAVDSGNAIAATCDARWKMLVEWAQGILAAAQAGKPMVRWERSAAIELARIAGDVSPEDVWQTTAAMFLLLSDQPARFRSDDAFRTQLARRVLALTERNAGTWWDHGAQRMKKVYRDLPPRVARLLGQALAESFGAVGLQVAATEKADEDARQQQRADYHAALEQIR